MMRITKQLILTSLFLASAVTLSAQEENGGDDYAVTASNVTLAIPLKARENKVLMDIDAVIGLAPLKGQ
ncbi:MAG: hypothetical protein ACSHX6_17220 [Akkermansiaceae bacterium]